jgi:hypothetical protein
MDAVGQCQHYEQILNVGFHGSLIWDFKLFAFLRLFPNDVEIYVFHPKTTVGCVKSIGLCLEAWFWSAQTRPRFPFDATCRLSTQVATH